MRNFAFARTPTAMPILAGSSFVNVTRNAGGDWFEVTLATAPPDAAAPVSPGVGKSPRTKAKAAPATTRRKRVIDGATNG